MYVFICGGYYRCDFDCEMRSARSFFIVVLLLLLLCCVVVLLNYIIQRCQQPSRILEMEFEDDRSDFGFLSRYGGIDLRTSGLERRLQYLVSACRCVLPRQCKGSSCGLMYFYILISLSRSSMKTFYILINSRGITVPTFVHLLYYSCTLRCATLRYVK